MRRERFLFVRLNDHEHQVVTDAAQARHMPVADYVRTLLRQATNTAPLSSTADTNPRRSDDAEDEVSRRTGLAAGSR